MLLLQSRPEIKDAGPKVGVGTGRGVLCTIRTKAAVVQGYVGSVIQKLLEGPAHLHFTRSCVGDASMYQRESIRDLLCWVGCWAPVASCCAAQVSASEPQTSRLPRTSSGLATTEASPGEVPNTKAMR